MNDGYDECITLISDWKEFRDQTGSGELADFANWLLANQEVGVDNNQVEQQLDMEGHEKFIIDRAAEMEEQSSIPDLANKGLIGHLLGRMNLFVKNYAKLPFQEIGFVNIEEFRLLQIVDRMKNINKSQLSIESLMEFSTVADVLKRLINQGLIIQVQDQQDKRANLLQTTAKGKRLLSKSYEMLGNLQPNVAGDLSLKEQESLIRLLLKLNHFHTGYFENNFTKKAKKK